MGRGIGNIIIGLIFVGGGLTGNLVFIGTESGGLLAAVGAGLVVWGIVQIVRSRSQS